ncbi:MAG: hypothetical protein ACI8ZN_000542 [Bacteroidia bacterium]|jgi:hypothetical protein
MNRTLNAAIFGLAIIIAALLLGKAYVDRSKTNNNIAITGLGETDFVSDLIVWEGRFNKLNHNLKQAFVDLEKDKEEILNYLISKGIDKNYIVFSSVNSDERSKRLYGDNGNYLGEEFIGYALSQSVEIKSSDVEKVERISREITELLNKGVQLYSQSPRYYYTKLADLKIEMISKATEDARTRAEKIAQNSGAKLGSLVSASMGIFQIVGQHSAEEYSWGGTFNTSSKEKTASITMKLVYEID